MKRIPLNTAVECTDGPYGRTIRVIVSPETLKPTHFVVKQTEEPGNEYLVPMERVAEISEDVIRLDCTKKEVAYMQPFSLTEYREVQVPVYMGTEMNAMAYPYYETQIIGERKEFIPAGERAITQGMTVRASDGKVGAVDELVVDPESGVLTHFVMRKKHVWGHKTVVIPLVVVDYVEGDIVYLKPDKETIQGYLGMPARRRQAAANMELIILLMADPGKPREMLKRFKAAAEADSIQLYGTAVLMKDEEGKAVIREGEDMDRRRGALFGAVSGGLVGLLGGPAGVVVGAVAGAATGGVAAHRIDLGLPDDYLKQLQSGLEPGTAAIVALVEKEWAAKASSETFGMAARLMRHQLTDDVLAQLGPIE